MMWVDLAESPYGIRGDRQDLHMRPDEGSASSMWEVQVWYWRDLVGKLF